MSGSTRIPLKWSPVPLRWSAELLQQKEDQVVQLRKVCRFRFPMRPPLRQKWLVEVPLLGSPLVHPCHHLRRVLEDRVAMPKVNQVRRRRLRKQLPVECTHVTQSGHPKEVLQDRAKRGRGPKTVRRTSGSPSG